MVEVDLAVLSFNIFPFPRLLVLAPLSLYSLFSPFIISLFICSTLLALLDTIFSLSLSSFLSLFQEDTHISTLPGNSAFF